MKIRAVILGTLADVFGTHLFLLALMLVVIDPGSSSVAPIERLDSGLLDAFCCCWGLFFTGVGGFVAGRLAPKSPVLHGLAVGLMSHAYSVLYYGWSPSEVGLPMYCWGTMAGLVMAVAGARVSRWLR